jgi:hypothetical protein
VEHGFRPMGLRPCLSTGLPLSVRSFLNVQENKTGLTICQARNVKI